MAISLNTSCLLDTNILVYAAHKKSSEHQKAVECLRKFQAADANIFVSSQNLLELSSVLIYALKISRKKVIPVLNNFISDSKIGIIYPTYSTLQKYCHLLETYKTVHTSDLFLTATALSNGIQTIVTNDSDFTKIKEIKVYNPFA